MHVFAMPCRLCIYMQCIMYIHTGIITLGDALQEDAKGIAVITMSAVLWCFLGVFPCIQVAVDSTVAMYV